MSIWRKIINNGKKLFQLSDRPKSVAGGFALGSFIGMMPIPGFQMMVSLALASLFKINRKAACIAVFNTNLFTGAFIFAFNYWLGKLVLGISNDFKLPDKLSFDYIQTILHAGTEIFLSLVLGGLITGVFTASITYFLILQYMNKRKNKIKVSSSMCQIKKKHCVITGASRGLGKAIAIECAKRKINLVLISLPNENLNNLAKDLENNYMIEAIPLETDLTSRLELEETTSWINKNFSVNMLINNAGLGGSNTFQNVSSQHIHDMLMLNIRALVFLTHSLLSNLKKNDHAYILNIASMASFGPMPYKSVYPASKAFVYSFSRGLHAELVDSGITVSVAHPGGMATNEMVAERINCHNKLIRMTILSPEKTAQICINQLFKKDSLIIPGIMNKLSYVFFKTCPVWLQLLIFRASIKKELELNKLRYA